ncbi:MAG: twin-arginine translocase subunit TatC [Thermoguttaceae bacterium]
MLKKNEDLFAESTMSFGDHLEELRICLWRAVIWLAGGFLIGLALGGYVVAYVQKPLNAALEKYYLDQATRRVQQDEKELTQEGYSVNGIARLLREKNLVPETYYVFPGQLENMIEQRTMILPELANDSTKLIDQIDNLEKYRFSGQHDISVVEQETVDRQNMTNQQKGDEVHHAAIQLNEVPRPLLLFKKIESLSGTRSKALGVHEPFSIYIKAALMVGVVLGSPGIFYSVWSFIAAGLYYHERKYVYIFMPISIILFILGVLFSFFIVFQYVLNFLFSFNAWMNIDPDTRISEWISFAFILPIGFGISFQLPMIVFVLDRIGVLPYEALLEKWKIAILVICVISVFLTPPDPQSMMLMVIPLTILYFLGIGLCYIFPKKKSEYDS